MPDEYDDLPLPEAEQRLRAEIEEHRSEMSRLGRRRARLIAAAVERHGRGGPAIVATETGLSVPAVNKLVHEDRKQRSDS
jgi:DNA-binding MurR/RpiR family transcriptional regulator